MEKEPAKRRVRFMMDILICTLGCWVYAVAMHMFIAPNNIAPGGVSGLAVVLQYLVPSVSIGAWSLLLNIPLLLLGLRALGLKFTLRTLATVLVLSVMIDHGATWLPTYQGDALLAALFAGVLTGVGLALVLIRGATTGGTDIISRLMQKKYPYIQFGNITMASNVFVILLSAVVFGKIETALYGVVTVFVSSSVVDTMLYGMDTGKLVYVMSTKSKEIAEKVIEKLGRGCTLLNSTGAFTQHEQQMLLVAVRRQQYYPLRRIVYGIDPMAFMIVTDSSEVIGKGFKAIEQEHD